MPTVLINKMSAWLELSNPQSDESNVFGNLKPVKKSTVYRYFVNYITLSEDPRIPMRGFRHSQV